jgi:hypothetical protein
MAAKAQPAKPTLAATSHIQPFGEIKQKKTEKMNNDLNDNQRNELAAKFLERHRFYSNRLWQYFAAILLINSIVLGSFDKFEKNQGLAEAVSTMSIALIGIFYHLLKTTDFFVC